MSESGYYPPGAEFDSSAPWGKTGGGSFRLFGGPGRGCYRCGDQPEDESIYCFDCYGIARAEEREAKALLVSRKS